MIPLVRRQQIVNAGLVGTAVALVVLVLATREKATTSELSVRENNLLQVYREQDITRIRVERPTGGFTIVRGRMDDAGDSTWEIKEPIQEDSEPFAVQKLLGTLEFSSALVRIKPEEVNRAAFGLDSPDLVVHLEMGDVKYRLRVGKEAASPRGAHYLEVAGENAPGKSVVIVSGSLVSELDVKLDDFREKYVMPYLSSVLDGITLEGAGGTRKLRRADWTNGWRFDGMLGDVRADRAALERVLIQFARTRADNFIEPDVAEKALAGGATVKVTMTPSNKASQEGLVEVGGKCPGNDADVVAMRRKPERIAACVPRSVLGGLTTPAEALVDRSLFWMRADEVEGFEIQRGPAKLALERKENGFVLRAPREGTVDNEAGNGRLESILHASGVIATPDEKAVGLDPPEGGVLVKSVAAEDSRVREEAVLVGRTAADGKVYVKRRHDGVVLELGREAARGLVADAALVRSRTIFDLPITDLARIEIDGTPRQTVERAESGVLTLTTPAGFEVDGALALTLADSLRALSAERWVTDTNDGTFGLESPTLTVRLSVRKDGRVVPHVLRIGRATGAGYYASVEEDPGVFVVPRHLHETLTTLVVDRSPFMLDLAATARVRLETPDRTLVLERRGDEAVQADATEPLGDDAVRRIVDVLTSLRAEAALEVGPPRAEHGMGRPVLIVRVDRVPGRTEKGTSTVFRVGAGDSWRGMSIHYARVDGMTATYAVARSNVRALLDTL